uniref:Uncharacterized protein n=1 Tax=Aplanochytrium stocchinoi TaxID=215587 RepID=A0A7S3LK65_9STRA
MNVNVIFFLLIELESNHDKGKSILHVVLGNYDMCKMQAGNGIRADDDHDEDYKRRLDDEDQDLELEPDSYYLCEGRMETLGLFDTNVPFLAAGMCFNMKDVIPHSLLL